MIEPAGTKGFHCEMSKSAFLWRQNPRFVHQLGKRYPATPNPWILGPRHDDKRVLKEKFEIKWMLNRRVCPCDQEVDLTLAQFLIDNFGLRNHEMNNDAGKASRDSIDDGGHEGWGQKGIASDAHLAGCGVGQKLDVFDTKSQVIEYGQAAVEQCATVLGWLD